MSDAPTPRATPYHIRPLSATDGYIFVPPEAGDDSANAALDALRAHYDRIGVPIEGVGIRPSGRVPLVGGGTRYGYSVKFRVPADA